MGKRKQPGGGASARSGNAAKKRKGSDHTSGNSTEKLYTLADEILVLGDGDFTFSRGLVAHRGGGRKLLATSYDSESKVKAKYSNAMDCLKAVRTAGAHVLHDVDATKLHLLPQQINDDDFKLPRFFKFIIFNFPHTGQQRVHINRALLVEFFESARDKLVKAGEVHITLKNRPPYSNWLVEDQAKAAGFVLKARRKFNLRNFPGYHHRTTDPQAKAFEAELCITYVFVVNRSKYPFDPTAAAQREQQLEELKQESEEPVSQENEEVHESEDEQESTVEEPVSKATKKPTKRKRSKRRATDATIHAAPPTPTSSNTMEQTVVKQTTRSKLWRPLHRR